MRCSHKHPFEGKHFLPCPKAFVVSIVCRKQGLWYRLYRPHWASQSSLTQGCAKPQALACSILWMDCLHKAHFVEKHLVASWIWTNQRAVLPISFRIIFSLWWCSVRLRAWRLWYLEHSSLKQTQKVASPRKFSGSNDL